MRTSSEGKKTPIFSFQCKYIHHQTHVFLKTPPIELPKRRQICCEKKTQVISSSVELVWHFRSNIVGPRNAIQSPKLKNTLQYVSVCCQFRLKSVRIRSSINMLSLEWMNYSVSGFFEILRISCIDCVCSGLDHQKLAGDVRYL